MRLQDCVLNGDIFVVAPFQRNHPEEKWVNARDSVAIPPELYDLYQAAGFLSFRAGSRYLTDDRNMLFSYFSTDLNCLVDGLVDAMGHLVEFRKDENLAYDPGKKIRGEYWDPEAAPRARRHLRDFLIALEGSLDTLADIIAIFLTGCIDRLQVGLGDFPKIERWVAQPLREPGPVSTPYDYHLQKLYEALKPLIRSGPPEEDWLPLMHTLRNKYIHLGEMTLRQMGLHDTNGKYYFFLPRKWPFIWETEFKPQDPNVKPDQADMPNLSASLLINQDTLSFAGCLHKRVIEVVRAAVCEVLTMYRAFGDFATNEAAIMELTTNTKTFKFENFVER